jgi:hypothetical protein
MTNNDNSLDSYGRDSSQPYRRRPRHSTRAYVITVLVTVTLAVLCIGGGCVSSALSDGPSAPGGASAAATTDQPSRTAEDVLRYLQANTSVVGNPSVQDENTDPNALLGRPGGYTSRAAFDLPDGDHNLPSGASGRGAVIEVWPSAADATRRSEHIQSLLADSPILGNEWHHLNGPVLLRVNGTTPPIINNTLAVVLANLDA